MSVHEYLILSLELSLRIFNSIHLCSSHRFEVISSCVFLNQICCSTPGQMRAGGVPRAKGVGNITKHIEMFSVYIMCTLTTKTM